MKVLLVDDEQYVRQEMATIVDWRAFGMELVGEASNGHEALRILSEQSVDLLFTDLSMPGISDLDYLAEVRKRYPELRIVVLTMHQEFHFIQEALRLGVDDYIAKVQIDRETFPKLLGEIANRVKQSPKDVFCMEDEVELLFSPEHGKRLGDASPFFHFRQAGDEGPTDAYVLRVSGVAGESYHALRLRLEAYASQGLFYAFSPDKRQYEVSHDQLALSPRRAALEESLAELFKAPNWLLSHERVEEALRLLPQLAMPREKLTAYLYQPFLRCVEYTGIDTDAFFRKAESLRWWYEWAQWLLSVKESVSQILPVQSVVDETMRKVVAYLAKHYRDEIQLQDILHFTAMSKSSFSVAFKSYTGHSYSSYLREIRIQKAQRLLLETGWSINRIGLEVGYPNERHFRRVFQQITGIAPKEYREQRSK